jgi:hypothetical protein
MERRQQEAEAREEAQRKEVTIQDPLQDSEIEA